MEEGSAEGLAEVERDRRARRSGRNSMSCILGVGMARVWDKFVLVKAQAWASPQPAGSRSGSPWHVMFLFLISECGLLRHQREKEFDLIIGRILTGQINE